MNPPVSQNLLIPVFATFWIVSFPEIPMMKLFAKIVGNDDFLRYQWLCE